LDNRANKGSTLGSNQNSGTIGSDVNFKGRKNDDLKEVGGNDKESQVRTARTRNSKNAASSAQKCSSSSIDKTVKVKPLELLQQIADNCTDEAQFMKTIDQLKCTEHDIRMA